jgi:hypothetical protein
MAVFDQGSISTRIKSNRKKERLPVSLAWLEGFNQGYGAAADRYLPIERKEKD